MKQLEFRLKTLANTSWEKSSKRNPTSSGDKVLNLRRRPTAVHLLLRRFLSFISRYVANSRSPPFCLPCFPISSSLSPSRLHLPWFSPSSSLSAVDTDSRLSLFGQSTLYQFFFYQINSQTTSSSNIYLNHFDQLELSASVGALSQ